MQSFLPILAPILGAFFVLYVMFEIKKSPAGEGKMVEIAEAIKEGAISYLKRQYRTIAVVLVALFVILYFIFGIKTGIGFLVGAALSALSGFVGMMISTQANVKVAEAAKKGMKQAFNLSFKGGLVTGLLVVSLGLLAVASFYFLTKDFGSLIALGFGASLISVFSRLGGGIYTKAADVGADIVGKVEKGIPEDDPRNPAVIADQVGDNVGDCAGMAADIFETYTVAIIATMILGNLLFPLYPQLVLLPLTISAVAIIASIVGSFFVILVFVFFVFRGFKIALKSPDMFGGLLVVGIVILVISQSFINIASMLGVIPLSGLPLIFFSQGGTSMFFTLAEMGIILNVSKYRKSA